MLSRVAAGAWILSWLVVAAPVAAESYLFPVNIHDEPLAISLNDLARQTGIELVFDRSLLGDRRSQALRGRLTVDAALRRLLTGTDLSMRRATSGAWIVERRPSREAPPPLDLSEPEILVIGRPTQDADIRRRENDIQPYQVSTGEQITQAHRDNLDQFFQSQITANTTVSSPSLGQGGDTKSSIDLRGLGTDKTLILVDGRRLPGVPGSGIGFGQPDISAIPLHAIERVETLTGTAGGIYGLDALGGVVNVVLRHDYHGFEAHVTTGINSGGDARRISLEGGVGFTPDHGQTDMSLFVSHSWQEPLLERQSNLELRGRNAYNRFAPDVYATEARTSNTVSVVSASGDDLIFKPQYGGASLGANYSFAPRGLTPPVALAAALTQNAGTVDLNLSSNEQAGDVDSTPTTTTIMANVRHHFGGGIEAYFDALVLSNHGRWRDPESPSSVTLSQDSPLNPFQSPINVIFEAPPANTYNKISYSSERYTLGIIASLPLNWRADADATFAASHYRNQLGDGYFDSLGYTGVECPGLDPFAALTTLERNASSCEHQFLSSEASGSRYREQSLRLAGPLFRSAAGPATFTITLQDRDESSPGERFVDIQDAAVLGSGESSVVSSRTQSIYGELLAPLFSEDSIVPILKGLTVQLAVRHDWQKSSYMGSSGEVRPSFSGTMYTAGVKFYPVRWLMVRGSYATGEQPPPSENLEEIDFSAYTEDLVDPKRGGTQPLSSDQYVEKVGALAPKKVFASTVAVGLVINPTGDGGPRFSIDYSHTRESGIYANPDLNLILAHEDMWPARVTRDPITEADREMGYTGGVIEVIDARGLSTADVNVKSVDVRLDWRVPLAGGILRTYGSVTRQLQNRQTGAVVDAAEFVGFVDGPLKWRANGGGEWSRSRTTLGANLQYFGRYRIAYSEELSLASLYEQPQGSQYVKGQAYLDLSISRRIPTYWAGTLHQMTVDLGIINVLDHAPPYQEVGYGPQFSPYGDPRGRRFELTLNASL